MNETLMQTVAILSLIYPTYAFLSLLDRKTMDINSDKDLRIETTGIREWDEEKRKLYHRTESTPYLALHTLVKKYPATQSDILSGDLVDFGSGRGRVAIYLHSQMNVNVTGVEFHKETFEQANRNMNAYKNYAIYSSKKRINFENIDARKYEIKKRDNKFFFFNPFNYEIFDEVLTNIKEDAEKNSKKVQVILYYKTRPYSKIMNKHKEFKKIKTIIPKGCLFYKERFTVYEFDCEEKGSLKQK